MTRRLIVAMAFAATLLASCSREEARQNTANAVNQVAESTRDLSQKVKDKFDSSVPVGPKATPQEIEKERFARQWQQVPSFRTPPAQPAAPPVAAPAPPPAPAPAAVTFVARGKAREAWGVVAPGQFDTQPVALPVSGDVAGPSVLRTQVLLDRARYSPGSIDGRWGKNSEIAVYWFQRQHGLPSTGDVDEATYRAIMSAAGEGPTLVEYALTDKDVAGPYKKLPDDVYEKEKLDCLCYESLEEMLTEKFHMTADLLERLNPGVDLKSATPGTKIVGLNTRPPIEQDVASNIQKIVVSVNGNYLHALDAQGNIVFHAPTTVGNKYDPSPTEELHIVGIAFNPHFHYQPTLFHEVPDSNPEAHLQPGPNSPVGVVWAALSKEHFGIHGTEDPDSIGYASSHGCIRLTNWDARDLAHQVKSGVHVDFVDTREEK